jgi:hypothetical protein
LPKLFAQFAATRQSRNDSEILAEKDLGIRVTFPTNPVRVAPGIFNFVAQSGTPGIDLL